MRNVAKQGKIVNLIAFLLGEVGRGPDRGRMRGRFTVAARKRVIAARLALISQRTGPLTASVSVPSAAYGGCTPTRACGRSPAGEAIYSPSTASITRSQSSKDRFVEQGRLTMYLR